MRTVRSPTSSSTGAGHQCRTSYLRQSLRRLTVPYDDQPDQPQRDRGSSRSPAGASGTGPISSTSRMIAETTPAIRVAFGNAPCQPHSADGSSRGSTPARRTVLRDVRATTLHPLPLTALLHRLLSCHRPCGCHIVAQHGQNGGDDHHDREDRRRTPRRPRARLHRVDRHAGAGRHRRPAGPVPRGRAGRRRTRTSRCSARQARAHGVRRVAVADPGRGRCAAAPGCCPGVEVLAGPDAAAELTATTPADTVLNGDHRLASGLGPTLAALATRGDAGAGQQGVAGRGRAAGDGGGAARADRPGRLRALRARPVPARRPRPTRSRGWC